MAVTLPSTNAGTLLPEWAATSINFNRAVQCVDGVMVAVFTAQIAYSLVNYLVQGGVKVGIVSNGNPQMGMGNAQDTFGSIYLDAEKLAAIAAAPATEGLSTFEAISALADGLIRADLIARKLITA